MAITVAEHNEFVANYLGGQQFANFLLEPENTRYIDANDKAKVVLEKSLDPTNKEEYKSNNYKLLKEMLTACHILYEDNDKFKFEEKYKELMQYLRYQLKRITDAEVRIKEKQLKVISKAELEKAPLQAELARTKTELTRAQQFSQQLQQKAISIHTENENHKRQLAAETEANKKLRSELCISKQEAEKTTREYQDLKRKYDAAVEANKKSRQEPMPADKLTQTIIIMKREAQEREGKIDTLKIKNNILKSLLQPTQFESSKEYLYQLKNSLPLNVEKFENEDAKKYLLKEKINIFSKPSLFAKATLLTAAPTNDTNSEKNLSFKSNM